MGQRLSLRLVHQSAVSVWRGGVRDFAPRSFVEVMDDVEPAEFPCVLRCTSGFRRAWGLNYPLPALTHSLCQGPLTMTRME